MELITAKEAGRILRRSPRTVIRWCDQGRLSAAHKLPGETGAYLFDRDEVAALRAEEDARWKSDEAAEGAA